MERGLRNGQRLRWGRRPDAKNDPREKVGGALTASGQAFLHNTYSIYEFYISLRHIKYRYIIYIYIVYI